MDAPRFDLPVVIGGYAVIAQLAQERSSDVYLGVTGARDEETPCVLKMRWRPKRALGQFTRFRHANLVGLLDLGEIRNAVYLTMEHLHGHDLFTIWNRCAQKRVPIPPSVAVTIVSDVLGGLGHVHGSGKVFGLLNPAKVMVAYDGSVKLLDAQSARVFVPDAGSSTSVGKPGYLAPEQVRGQPATAASDLFSAGIMLWELLVGRPMFPRWSLHAGRYENGELARRYAKVVGQPPVAPSKINGKSPPHLDRVVVRALAVAREDRFASAADFRRALNDAASALPREGADVGSFVRSLYENHLDREQRQIDMAVKAGRFLLADVPSDVRRLPREVELGEKAEPPASPPKPAGSSPRPSARPVRTRLGRTVGVLGIGAVALGGAVLASRVGGIGSQPESSKERATVAAARDQTQANLGRPSPFGAPPARPFIPAAAPVPPLEPKTLAPAVTASAPVSPSSAPRSRRKPKREESTAPAVERPSAKALLEEAETSFERGNIAGAYRSARMAVDAGGGAPALLLLGDLHVYSAKSERDPSRSEHDLEQALAIYEKVAKLAPGDQLVERRRDLVRRIRAEAVGQGSSGVPSPTPTAPR